MKAVFWSRTRFAEQEISQALKSVSGIDLHVEQSLRGFIASIPDASFLCLTDPPPEDAVKISSVIRQPGCKVRAVHFSSAGREGFNAAGLPPHLAITGPGDALSSTVAEHAIACALSLMRRLPSALAAQQAGHWVPQSDKLSTLEGSQVVLAGYGNICKALACRLSVFGCSIKVASRSPVASEFIDEWQPLFSLPQLVGAADLTIACLALADETRHIFSRAVLQAFKPGALLVNVGRGGLVETEALIDALRSGSLGGAALDVTEPEPLPDKHPLFNAPNLLLTAHYAGASPSGARHLAEAARRSLETCLKQCSTVQ